MSVEMEEGDESSPGTAALTGGWGLCYLCPIRRVPGQPVDQTNAPCDDLSTIIEHNHLIKQVSITVIDRGHLRCLKRLLKDGTLCQLSDSKEKFDFQIGAGVGARRPLVLAAKNGHKDIVDFLVGEKLVDVNNGAGDFTPLGIAASSGHLEICRTLISAGANVNQTIGSTSTPLHYSVQGGHLEIVKLLVKRGANVHTINDAGYTALQLAMEMGHEEMFIFLLSNGATFASVRGQGRQAEFGSLELQILERHFEKHCIEIDNKENTMKLTFDVFMNHCESIVDNSYKGWNLFKYFTLLKKKNDDYDVESGNMTNRNKKEIKNRSLLELLASDQAMSPLCKHPYITAFLDIHYSTLKKQRTQMRASNPLLAQISLLMLLLSMLSQHKGYINLLVLIIPCSYMILLDGISIIGLKTNLIDKAAQLSLVRDRKSKLDLSCWMNVNDFMDLFIHLIGYFISLASLMVVVMNYCKDNEKVEDDHGIFVTIVVYVTLLMVKEMVLACSTQHLKPYFKHSNKKKNLTLMCFTLAVGIVYLTHEDIKKSFPWLPVLISIAVIIAWFSLSNELLECLPVRDLEQYLHMFYHVAKSYLKIMACFFPFYMAFTLTFKSMSSKDGPYARNLIDALVKTFVMFIGEIDELSFADLSNYTIRNPKQNIVYLNDTNVTYNVAFGSDVEVDWDKVPDSIKVQIVLGQLVFIAFVFLFVIVILNLLNAVAIGDIQKLRDDALSIGNRKKLREILEQSPNINKYYLFDSINCKPQTQGKGYLWQYLLPKKGHFGKVEYSTDGMPHWTLRRLRTHTTESEQSPKTTFSNVVESAIRAKRSSRPLSNRPRGASFYNLRMESQSGINMGHFAEYKPFIPYTTFLGLKQCTRTDEQASKIEMMESNIIAACNEKMEESNNLLRQMAITLQQASQK